MPAAAAAAAANLSGWCILNGAAKPCADAEHECTREAVAERRAVCANHGPGARTRMAAYKHARAGCVWRPVRERNWEYDYFPDTPDYLASTSAARSGRQQKGATKGAPTQAANRCEVPAAEQGARWLITRVGPFRSRGGYDWHNFLFDDWFGLHKNFTGAGGGLALSATLLAPVDAAGELIGYPPLHIHHAHLEKLVNGPGNGRGAHGHKVGAAV
jgi:hypothetical protein